MDDVIRCFIAIDLPMELKDKLSLYLKELRPMVPQIKWVRTESLHLTLKFLGEISPSRVEAAKQQLDRLSGTSEFFQIAVSHFGAFPSEKHPRVFWLGLHGIPQEPFYQLQSRIEDILNEIGFEKEKRRFSPHLTLGRLKFPQDISPVWDHVNAHPFPEYAFVVSEFILMRSILKPMGAEYSPIQKYSLRRL